MHRISRWFALYIKTVCFTSHAYRYSIVYMCKYWLYEQNGRSKLFNFDSVWVTLEYGLFFLNCYEWCKFPFTQWSVDIILSKEPVFYFFHTRELYSVRCKKCKHTRQKKLRFSEVKKKNVIFTFIADRFYTGLKIMTINKYKCDFWSYFNHFHWFNRRKT